MGEFGCPQCGREFPDAESLDRHLAAHRRGAEDRQTLADEPAASADVYSASTGATLVDRVIAGAGMLWRGFWTLIWIAIGIAVVVGIAIGIFGGGDGDDEAISVSRSAPGYAMLSSLEANGEIDEFQAVEPDDGWTYQYEINGDSELYVQFRGSGRTAEMQINYPSYDEDVADAISEAAADQGYATQ